MRLMLVIWVGEDIEVGHIGQVRRLSGVMLDCKEILHWGE